MENAVNCLNVRQESIAKPLPPMCARDESSDVENRQSSRHFALGLEVSAEPLVAIIRHCSTIMPKTLNANPLVIREAA